MGEQVRRISTIKPAPPPLQQRPAHTEKTPPLPPGMKPPMPFLKPCLVCGELTRQTSYCPPHRPIKVDSPERKAKKAAMYGGDYRRRARAVKSSATHCHLCNKPFEWGDTVEADHLIPGQPDSPLAPAHRKCNQQRGNTPLQG